VIFFTHGHGLLEVIVRVRVKTPSLTNTNKLTTSWLLTGALLFLEYF